MENSEELKNAAMASENFVLTPDMLKPLKCSFCSLSLSYPPIYLTTQEDVKYKCGRCSIKTRFNFRDVMYEELAKNMKFPCIYKNCTESLAWDDVRDHEKDCTHRTLPCLATDCQEVVLQKDFALHFKDKHNNMYHSDKMVLDNFHGSGFSVLEKDDNCYILLFDTNIDKIRLSLCGIRTNDKQFEIVFKDKDSKHSIILAENNIVFYNERVHCFKCLRGECKLEYHMYCHYRKGMLKYANGKIDKDILKRTFGNNVTCVINIVDEKVENEHDELDDLLLGKEVVVDEVTEEDEGEEKLPEPNKADIIKDLINCPGCEQLMSEPIFQCLEGHAVCKDCKTKAEDSKCASCECKIENTRNYIIEEVINNLRLNKDAKTVAEKEIMCPMSKCHENVKLSTISNHFKESHIENFHFNKVTLKNVYGYYNVDVLVRNGKTYLLFFDFDDFNFGISVCSVDSMDELYDIKLISDNKRCSLVASDQKVIMFNDKEHCFKCSIGICKISDHTFRVKRKEIFRRLTTKLNRDSVKRAFKCSSLSYQINIKESKENKTEKIIRQLFECPICKDYMVPPIHQCIAGHSLCNVCKTKVEKCPSCEGSIQETRNFILESIADKVELPCSFESKSCPFRGAVKRMATHELDCPLNTKKVCTEKAKIAQTEKVNSSENEVSNNADGAAVDANETPAVNSNETPAADPGESKEEAMETDEAKDATVTES